MKEQIKNLIILIILPLMISSCEKKTINIERPEKIVSKRQKVYDNATYSKLAESWKAYYQEFPSEDAYANWMYAARYANWSNYQTLLNEGIDEYPANPTLLYLKALTKHGQKESGEAIELLERAIELDPSFIDPWYGLATDYLGMDEIQKSEHALKMLLENHAVSDVIMDYNYNVISMLDKNAILITNGDNDTYPAWIITKIIKYRPDVKIVNRSLLNTDWYPINIIANENLPEFVTEKSLIDFREQVLAEIKNGTRKMPKAGPFSDLLISKLVKKCAEEERPIYLASTLFITNTLEELKSEGTKLGLATKLNLKENKEVQISNVLKIWLGEFRTGGISSLNLRYSNKLDARKIMTRNYAGAIAEILKYTPKLDNKNVNSLFNWYIKHVNDLLPDKMIAELKEEWCKIENIEEIRNWCNNQN